MNRCHLGNDVTSEYLTGLDITLHFIGRPLLGLLCFNNRHRFGIIDAYVYMSLRGATTNHSKSTNNWTKNVTSSFLYNS